MATARKHRITSAPGSDFRRLTVITNELSTLGAEVATDHATTKVTLDQLELLAEELAADHATFVTGVTALETLLNQIRFSQLYQSLGNPTFAIDTNFDVKSTEPISYLNGGTLKTLADNANFDTGTAAAIATTQWGAAMLSVNSSGTGVVTWFTAAGAGYASEAAAIAAMTIGAATDTPLGYVTVLAAGATWTAGTDALTGGTGGTVATTTNYYNSINANTLYIGAAVASAAPATLSATTAITSGPATLTATVTGDTVVTPAGGTVGM